MIRTVGALVIAGFWALSPVAAQQQNIPEIEIVATNPDVVEGAAEISDFRSVIEQSNFVPQPNTLSLESLLADYSLALPTPADCGAAICIGLEAMPADFSLRPADDVFVGLSFSQRDRAASLSNAQLNLVLVIDRSGSMKGWKLDEVKSSLLSVLSSLKDSDRVGIISFGSTPTLDLQSIEVATARNDITRTIERLKAGGETDMEAGLKMGFEHAQAFGASRVVLLTDDKPNIYGARVNGFMDLAETAASHGIGLSLVGVDQNFDNTIALQLASLEGGRFYEFTPHFDIAGQFERAWPSLLGGGAEGGSIILTPGEGRKISTIFGVPKELVSHSDNGSVSLQVSAGFLSQRGNGIYVGLAPAGDQEAQKPDSLLEARLSFHEAGKVFEQQVSSAAIAPGTSTGLKGAQELIEEYLVLDASLSAWHRQGDPERAAELAAFLNASISRSGIAFLERERRMVSKLLERMTMALGSTPPVELVGQWMVQSERGLSGASVGDLVEFTDSYEFLVHQQSGPDAGVITRQTYQQNLGTLLIDNTDLVFDYQVSKGGTKLVLKAVEGNGRLKMRRVN